VSTPTLPQIHFSEAFDDYLMSQRARNLSDGYKAMLITTRDYWLRRHGDAALEAIAPEHIRAWLIWLGNGDPERDDAPRAPRGNITSPTIDRHFRGLKSFMLWCEREEYYALGRAPIRKVDRPKVIQREPDALTPEEIQHLLKRVRSNGDRNAYRDYCIHLFFSVTCARLGEVANLNWSRVFPAQGYALVFGQKDNAERPVPLSPELCLALTRYRRKYRIANEGEEAVFTNESGRRLERRGMRSVVVRDIRRYIARPICKVGPHTWRRTGATILLDAGVSIQDMKDILGHADIRTTLTYRKKTAVQAVLSIRAFPIDALLNGQRPGFVTHPGSK
jgi:integrase